MYYFLVRLIDPPLLLLLLTGVGLALAWRKPGRRRLLLATIPFGLYFLLCVPAVSFVALGTLEWGHTPLEQLPEDTDVIVVLSGDVRWATAPGGRVELGTDTLARCLRAAELYHKDGPRRILVSGGEVYPGSGLPAVALVMRDFLIDHGVRPADVLVESTSQTTYENAVECSKVLQEHGLTHVVLVTDAAHLPRALACFRKQGVDAVPCGCRYRAAQLSGPFEAVLPGPGALEGFRVAWHEWLGLLWYSLRGRM